MKLVTWFLLLAVSLQTAGQKVHLFEDYRYRMACINQTRNHDGKPGPAYWQNSADYTMDIRLDTTLHSISGSAVIIYHNESPDTLQEMVLRLYPNRNTKGAIRNIPVSEKDIRSGMKLDSLIIGQQEVFSDSSRVRMNGTNMFIELSDPIPPGTTCRVFTEWSYPLSQEMDFRRTGYYGEGRYFVGYFYPQVAVYDDLEDWDDALFHLGIQEFYNDLNTFSVTVHLPRNYMAWATGDLTNEDRVYSDTLRSRLERARTSDAIVPIITAEDIRDSLTIDTTWVFRANEVRDFAFAVSRNHIWDGTSVRMKSGRRVFVDVVYPPESHTYPKAILVARESVRYTSEDFPAVEFPFTHATTFNNGFYSGGGMEWPMIANNSDEDDHRGLTEVVFHELFHNYFPFYMGINEKRYPWMDEGWAEYVTGRFLASYPASADFPSGENPDKYIDKASEVYVWFVTNRDDMPLYDSYAAINMNNFWFFYYLKPQMAYRYFIEMVGEKDFLKAFHGYIDRWQGKHPSPYDFFYSMNDLLGKDYNWYWKAWFFDYGYPDLGLELIDGKLYVVRAGAGALPLPANLSIKYTNGQVEKLHFSAEIWENGDDRYRIKNVNPEEIDSIILITNDIPDIDKSNNLILLQ